MTNGGAGGIVFIGDAEENVNRVSTAGRIFMSESFSRVKNHSPINVVSASGGSEFETVAVGRVILRSESGNSLMWWGGTGEDAPYSGHGMPLWGGESTVPLPVTNFNTLRVVASISGQVVYAIGFLNGSDTTLSNTTPVYPDITAPFVVSHSPVSGFSGVALNSDVTVTFSEPMSEASLVSGVFSLSPAHNVTFYRDTGDTSKIVLSPNQNLSGVTVYMAKVTTAIRDLGGNQLSGQLTFPFTTVSGAPPPDTTPPTISGIIPTSGSQEVVTSIAPTVTFSEKMLSGTINSTTLYISTLSGAGAGNVATMVTLNALDQKTVTLTPDTSLTNGTIYYINVTTGVQDLASNALATARTNHQFTTTYNFVQIYHVTGTDGNNLRDGDETRAGLVIAGTSAMKGPTVVPRRVTVRLKKTGSPTGSAFIRQRTATTDNVACEFGSIDVSTLTTSFAEYTFTNINNIEPLDSDGDKLLVEYTGGNSSNYITVARNDSGDVFNNVDYVDYDGSYADVGGSDIAFTVYK